MKRQIYILLLTALHTALCCSFAGCGEDKKVETGGVAVEKLISPADGEEFSLAMLLNLGFEWEKVRSASTAPVNYEVLFDSPDGDFSSPLESVQSSDGGQSPYAKIERSVFYSIGQALGAGEGQKVTLKWTVRCTQDGNSTLSPDARTISFIVTSSKPVPTYENPLFTDFSLPDPDVIRGDDGYFYLYATEHSRTDPNMKNSPVMRSSDLINWTRVGSIFTDATHPQITNQNPAGIWAPSVNKVGDKYVIYYSQPGLNYKHAIGVASSDTPVGPFTDHGKIIDSNEQGVDISIDAYLYQENGRNYLFWGSFRAISVIELTADGLALKPGDVRTVVAGGQYEAAVVEPRNGYYYLILSTGDYSKHGTYRLVVGRSENILGPYVDKNGRDMKSVNHALVLQGNTEFSSPGHCSRIITDDAGQDWILYHAYPEDMNFRCLMLDRLDWVDGWPIVNDGYPSSRGEGPVFL